MDKYSPANIVLLEMDWNSVFLQVSGVAWGTNFNLVPEMLLPAVPYGIPILFPGWWEGQNFKKSTTRRPEEVINRDFRSKAPALMSQDPTNDYELLYFPEKQFSSRFGDGFFTYKMNNFTPINGDSCQVPTYIVYNLTVFRGKTTWLIGKRYSEFVVLIDHLKQTYAHLRSEILALPPKSCFRILNDESFLNERMELLDKFLDELLRVLSRQKLMHDHKVMGFLGLR